MQPHPRTRVSALFLVAIGVLAGGPVQAAISDLDGWTLVEDPPDQHFNGLATPSEIVLTADGGPIPDATDIGFQSVDGATPPTSGSGYAFSPLYDFAIAIDFDMSLENPSGQLGIGFGIGEDINGEDSAGVALLVDNGTPSFFFGAAARVDDATQAAPIFVGGSLSGSMFVGYDAVSGDVTLGASQSKGAAAPTGASTFTGLQDLWPGGDLLVSVFLRSDDTAATAWQSGQASVVFSNLRVLSGAPYAIPAPAPAPLALLLPGLLAVGLGSSRRSG